MTHHEFNQLRHTVKALPPEQMRQLRDEIDRELARPRTGEAHAGDETAFDVARRAGLIGCIAGRPRSPTDLSTNPKHMEGFGHA